MIGQELNLRAKVDLLFHLINLQASKKTEKSTGYLPWVREYNNNNDDDGYAGIKGSAIDKLQIRIVKK